MKRLAFTALVVAFGVGVAALGGKKFWEQKEYSDWSRKEIRNMLAKSPWARAVNIYPGGTPAPRLNTEGGGSLGGPPTQGPTAPGSTSPGASPGGFPGAAGGGPGGGSSASILMTIRWCSALPIRQALAAQQNEDLQREVTHYAIGLTGATAALFSDGSKAEPDSDPWEALSERLKAESSLKVSGRDPIQPVEIGLRKVPDPDVGDEQEGAEQHEVLLLFPRSLAISLQDKQVEFVTRVARQKVKKKFKLKDMLYKGELEL